MIFFGEDLLRNAICEFVAHCHLERNHEGLGNRLIVPITPAMREELWNVVSAWAGC